MTLECALLPDGCMKISKAFYLMSLSVLGLAQSAFGQGNTALEATINRLSDNNFQSQLNLLVPVESLTTDYRDVRAVVGIGKSSTKTGSFETQNINGRNQTVPVDDGSATYLTLGLEGRSVIFNKKWLEGFLRGTYGVRTGGTTEYSRYTEATGQIFDPEGGANASVGVSVNRMVSLQYVKNLGGEKDSTVLISFEFPFDGRDDVAAR